MGNSEANLSACHGHKQGIIHAPFFPCAVTVFIYIYNIYIYIYGGILVLGSSEVLVPS